MKKLILLLFIPIVFSCNSETIRSTTGSESNIGGVLNGRVKGYTMKTFNATSKFGEPIKGDEKMVSIFDAFELKSRQFNEAGNEIESEMGTGFKHIYEYNEEGNIAGWSGFDKTELSVKWIYELDNQLNIIKSSSYDPNGSLNFYTRNLYNEDGENYESIQYDSNGDLSRKTEKIYGDSGKEIERIEYDKKGKIYSKYTYKYDSITLKKISQKYFEIKNFKGDISSAKSIHSYFFKKNVVNQDFNTWFSGALKDNEYVKRLFALIVEASNYNYKIDNVVKYKTIPNPFPNVRQSNGSPAPKTVQIEVPPTPPAWYNDMPNSLKISNYTSFDEWSKKVFPTPHKKLVLKNEITYDYNDKGDLILENKNGELKEYKYDYDEYENWIVKYEYLYGKIKYITERNIQYYQ